MSPSPLPRTILYAEDDPDDFQLLKSALLELDPAVVLVEVPNGRAALTKLYEYESAGTLPALVILDINMPLVDGRQTIRLIQEEPRFQALPIVAFTTSTSSLDKLLCQKLRVNCFTKPDNLGEFRTVAAQLLGFAS